MYKVIEPDPVPSVFFGIASGINNYSGIAGIGLEAPILTSVTFFGQAGIGSWGTKVGGGIRYYRAVIPYGSAWAIGYSQASGLKDVELELDVLNPTRKMNVLLDLYKVGTLNLDYSYHLKLGRMSKLCFHAGYAIRLNSGDNYKVKTPGVQLSNTAHQSLLYIQPGGLLLGLSLMFGVR